MVALGTMISWGSGRLHLQQWCIQAYHSCNDNVVSLGEIALAMLMSTGLLSLQGQSCKGRRDHACNNDVARLIALVTTMSQSSRDCACDDGVARLGEIALAKMAVQGCIWTASLFRRRIWSLGRNQFTTQWTWAECLYNLPVKEWSKLCCKREEMINERRRE